MPSTSLLKRISIDPHICHGRPRVSKTRIPVSLVMELLAQGYTPAEICSDRFYPDLTTKDVLACIAFANQFLSEEEIHFAEELRYSHKS